MGADGSDVLAGVLSDGGATYVPGLSERRSGNTSFMHGGMKSTEARTSSSGAVSSTRVYDAFGQAVSGTGTWAGPAGYGGRFGYREDGTGLRLLGHRLYDPAAGRFVSRDPARDGGNWYAYCEGDPVNGADPSGLRVIFVGLGAQVILGGFSFSYHVDLVLDTDNGNLGINPNAGFGPAAGLSASAGVEAGIDNGGSVGPGYQPTSGWATGLSTPIMSVEAYDVGGPDAWINPQETTGTTGGGISAGGGLGFGLYREKRLGSMFHLADLW